MWSWRATDWGSLPSWGPAWVSTVATPRGRLPASEFGSADTITLGRPTSRMRRTRAAGYVGSIGTYAAPSDMTASADATTGAVLVAQIATWSPSVTPASASATAMRP